jgi:hypothetical protein
MSLATEIVKQFKALFQGSISAADRKLLADCATTIAEVQIELLRGNMTAAQAKRERAHVDATLANLKSAGEGRAVATFWKAVNLATAVVTKTIAAA